MRRHADPSFLPPSFSPAPVPPATPAVFIMAEPRAPSLEEVHAADVTVDGPDARRDYGVSGAGIRIGILSDSYNLLGGAASDIQAGFLPAGGVTVLKEGAPGGIDEGRAMAEMVHATAPDARLYFYTAFNSEQDFAAGIDALRGAGCQIIVDDTTYPEEPMFQVGGPIDAAVERAVAAGVDYFTSAGNEGDSFYQAAFSPFATPLTGFAGFQQAQRFSNGGQYQTVVIPGGEQVTLTLQWDAPYNAANPDSITVVAVQGSTLVARSTQVGQLPDVLLDFPVQAATATYAIGIVNNIGTPRPSLIKYVLEGGGTISDPQAGIGSGSEIGHALAPGANAVGANSVLDTSFQGNAPRPEPYSSTGPGQFLFAPDGTRLATPQNLATPAFLAPDGAATGPIDPFFGTSAAAPVAAAVAALMLQSRPGLTPGDVSALLADSALPAGDPSVAGAGLIRAYVALQYAVTGDIVGAATPVLQGTAQNCTIEGGTGTRDIYAGSGNTVMESLGQTTVGAGAGTDTIALAGPSALLFGSSGMMLVSTYGADTVIADTGPTSLYVVSGTTLFYNGSGNATMLAGPGADTLFGNSGSVTVVGGSGPLLAFGGYAGRNLMVSGSGQSTMLGAGLGDTLQASGNLDLMIAAQGGGDTLLGGSGIELMVGGTSGSNVYQTNGASALVAPLASNAVITFGSGQSTLQGGTGAELVQLIDGQPHGPDYLYSFDPNADKLLLTGYGAAAQQVVPTQYDINGDSWLTLPDGTIVAFVGLDHLSASSVMFS